MKPGPFVFLLCGLVAIAAAWLYDTVYGFLS